MHLHATILAVLTAGAVVSNHASLTAKAPNDVNCTGRNTDNHINLERWNPTVMDLECVPYLPSTGSNIFITIGNPEYYTIDVYSDPPELRNFCGQDPHADAGYVW